MEEKYMRLSPILIYIILKQVYEREKFREGLSPILIYIILKQV